MEEINVGEVKREEETAEALWGEREEDNEKRMSKMRAKEDELRSWKENKVYRVGSTRIYREDGDSRKKHHLKEKET